MWRPPGVGAETIFACSQLTSALLVRVWDDAEIARRRCTDEPTQHAQKIGITQGNPLSAFLFLFIMDPFSVI